LRAQTLIGHLNGAEWLWDYACDCGQQYRVASTGQGVQFWPTTNGTSFRREPFRAGVPCLICGEPLRLDGVAVEPAA